MDPQHPTTLVKTELERALSEQSFGISAYAIVSSTELEATAVVTLLEGRTLSVVLTPRGYEARCDLLTFEDSKKVLTLHGSSRTIQRAAPTLRA